ncbi:MAG: MlaA family lipoprotein [Thiomonas sp.]|jgi:phospholipid-binding lipoprotein MlaA
MTQAVRIAALLVLAVLAGCATHNPQDPLEPYNRAMFTINDKVDRAVVKPAATAYKAVTPTPIRHGVTNFFGNFGDIWSMANDFLQGNVKDGLSSFMRVGVNTVFGLFGTLDIATEMGIYKHPNDFGLTLARWGVGSGPYLVLPFYGPSTVRDGVGTGMYLAYGPSAQISPPSANYGALALNLVNTRANLLDASNLFDQISLDPYVFARSAYEQRRKAQVQEVRDRPIIDLGEPDPLAKYSYGPSEGSIFNSAPIPPQQTASSSESDQKR